MSSWKAAESRVGSWFGAKGISKSGRVPLSGGGSGSTRSDSPHRTIFIETKRDKTYHSVIRKWKSVKKKVRGKICIQSLPLVSDNKIIKKFSDLWCFHNSDFGLLYDYFVHNCGNIYVNEWSGSYPRVVTLYEQSLSIKNSSVMDRNKEVVCCSIVYHRSPGFWVIIDKKDIVKCWELILKEREYRKKIIEEEDGFKRNM